MDRGIPYYVIPDLEESEFYDWLAASQALDIDKKLLLMNIAVQPNVRQSDRTAEFNRLKTEQMILLGDNPFAVNEAAIQRTRETLKKMRVRRVKKDGDNNKRNSGQIKT